MGDITKDSKSKRSETLKVVFEITFVQGQPLL